VVATDWRARPWTRGHRRIGWICCYLAGRGTVNAGNRGRSAPPVSSAGNGRLVEGNINVGRRCGIPRVTGGAAGAATPNLAK
jgi:hypothetical protein